MPDPINNLAAAAPAAGTTRQAVAAELVKITQPLDGLLAAGESVDAEVVSVKQGNLNFQLLLRLSLAGGGVATIAANSSQPLAQGTSLLVSNLAGSAPLVTLQQVQSANVATLTQIDTQKLAVGTLLQGKVLSSELLPAQPGQPAVYRAMVTLLNTALVGNLLTLDSPQPLRPGSLLSAQVQDSQALRFVPLSGRMDQLAVAQQLLGQTSRQGSLQGLLGALQSLSANQPQNPNSPAGAALPADARATVEKLLASLPDVRQMADPRTVASAVLGSGAFMEANLLNGQPAPDLKSALLRLVAQLAPGQPGNPTFNPVAAATVLAQAMPGRVRNALNALGQVSEKPQPTSFPLASRSPQKIDGDDDLEHLLRLAGAAVARLQSHQLAGLEQTGTTPEGKLQTTWQLEIPMRNLQDFVPLQVKIHREDSPDPHPRDERREPGAEPRERLWRIDLAFDLHPLGPLQVQAQLAKGTLSSQLWAEQPATASLIASQLTHLRERLVACGLNVGELDCHAGKPPSGPRAPLQQRWVDETA